MSLLDLDRHCVLLERLSENERRESNLGISKPDVGSMPGLHITSVNDPSLQDHVMHPFNIEITTDMTLMNVGLSDQSVLDFTLPFWHSRAVLAKLENVD
ncbi:hypothetical protein N7486_005649 [Penicillium sp. IBT 16267x]|nr:hypothetical protein N7486_005649 [Penicillium sp. IBT 16267x]